MKHSASGLSMQLSSFPSSSAGEFTILCLQAPPKADEMERLSQAWRPYRSLGSFYMWRLLAKKGASAPKKAKAGKAASKAAAEKVPM